MFAKIDAMTESKWAMPDSTGITPSPADLNGKVTYLFFGFTSGPDVCPTTMVELNRIDHL